MLGAILHPSNYGHTGSGQHEVTHRGTPKGSRFLRRSRDQRSLKILVIASSNQAVDNMLDLECYQKPDYLKLSLAEMVVVKWLTNGRIRTRLSNS